MHVYPYLTDQFARKCAAKELNVCRQFRWIARWNDDAVHELFWRGRMDGFRSALHMVAFASMIEPLTNPAQPVCLQTKSNCVAGVSDRLSGAS